MKPAVWMFFLCQALMTSVTVGQVAMGALVGHTLASDKSLATLPMAIQMTATMAASIPAGFVFGRFGRRPGFWLGCAGSFIGSLVFAAGIWTGSFSLYCLGAVPAGLGFGIAQHLRFAAAEAAEPAMRPRAIALVMAGGLVAAVLGPELVKQTKDAAGPLLFVGTYLAFASLPAICAVILVFADLPRFIQPPTAPVPLSLLVARADFIVAVLAGLVGYGSMNLVMTSTPVQMILCGYGVDASTDVIRAHAVAMFGPGFVTGRLIHRFGCQRVIVAGGMLSIACAALSLAGSAELTFMTALVLLGIGWNFMFTGATALLSQAHDPSERIRAQALNDFIVFGTVAGTAFASGLLHDRLGWIALNGAIVPPILVASGLVMWHRKRRRLLTVAA